jgi:hypothetical protein
VQTCVLHFSTLLSDTFPTNYLLGIMIGHLYDFYVSLVVQTVAITQAVYYYDDYYTFLSHFSSLLYFSMSLLSRATMRTNAKVNTEYTIIMLSIYSEHKRHLNWDR